MAVADRQHQVFSPSSPASPSSPSSSSPPPTPHGARSHRLQRSRGSSSSLEYIGEDDSVLQQRLPDSNTGDRISGQNMNTTMEADLATSSSSDELTHAGGARSTQPPTPEGVTRVRPTLGANTANTSTTQPTPNASPEVPLNPEGSSNPTILDCAAMCATPTPRGLLIPPATPGRATPPLPAVSGRPPIGPSVGNPLLVLKVPDQVPRTLQPSQHSQQSLAQSVQKDGATLDHPSRSSTRIPSSVAPNGSHTTAGSMMQNSFEGGSHRNTSRYSRSSLGGTSWSSLGQCVPNQGPACDGEEGSRPTSFSSCLSNRSNRSNRSLRSECNSQRSLSGSPANLSASCQRGQCGGFGRYRRSTSNHEGGRSPRCLCIAGGNGGNGGNGSNGCAGSPRNEGQQRTARQHLPFPASPERQELQEIDAMSIAIGSEATSGEGTGSGGGSGGSGVAATSGELPLRGAGGPTAQGDFPTTTQCMGVSEDDAREERASFNSVLGNEAPRPILADRSRLPCASRSGACSRGEAFTDPSFPLGALVTAVQEAIDERFDELCPALLQVVNQALCGANACSSTISVEQDACAYHQPIDRWPRQQSKQRRESQQQQEQQQPPQQPPASAPSDGGIGGIGGKRRTALRSFLGGGPRCPGNSTSHRDGGNGGSSGNGGNGGSGRGGSKGRPWIERWRAGLNLDYDNRSMEEHFADQILNECGLGISRPSTAAALPIGFCQVVPDEPKEAGLCGSAGTDHNEFLLAAPMPGMVALSSFTGRTLAMNSNNSSTANHNEWSRAARIASGGTESLGSLPVIHMTSSGPGAGAGSGGGGGGGGSRTGGVRSLRRENSVDSETPVTSHNTRYTWQEALDDDDSSPNDFGAEVQKVITNCTSRTDRSSCYDLDLAEASVTCHQTTTQPMTIANVEQSEGLGPSTTVMLFQQQIENIAADIRQQSSKDAVAHKDELPLFLCQVVGVLRMPSHSPNCSKCFGKVYQWLVLAIVAAAAVLLIESIWYFREGLWTLRTSCVKTELVCINQMGLMSFAPVSVAAFLGVGLLGAPYGGKPLSSTLRLLLRYGHRRGVVGHWKLLAVADRRFIVVSCAIAIASAVSGTILEYEPEQGMRPLLSLSALAFVVLANFALAYCLLILCRAMTVMVDTFGCHILEARTLADAMHEWNVLQAILRKTSAVVELSFVVLLGLVALAVPSLLADFFVLGIDWRAILALLPNIVVVAGALRVLLLAASVSDKCSRVPSLVNSLPFSPGTERIRQHIVEYVAHSSVGFYIADVRLTTELVFKFLYTWSIVAFGVGSTLVSKE